MLAYLDPGSGSLIASAVVGGVASAAVVANQARHRLSSRFGRKRKHQPEVAEDGGPDTAEVEVVDAESPAVSDS